MAAESFSVYPREDMGIEQGKYEDRETRETKITRGFVEPEIYLKLKQVAMMNQTNLLQVFLFLFDGNFHPSISLSNKSYQICKIKYNQVDNGLFSRAEIKRVERARLNVQIKSTCIEISITYPGA